MCPLIKKPIHSNDESTQTVIRFGRANFGLEALRQRGWQFYTFIGGGARFMFAWDSDEARVDALVRDIREVSAAAL